MATKAKHLCTAPKCRSTRKGGELCGYHETLEQFGPRWAVIAYPNHPEAQQQRGPDETRI